MLNDCGCFIIVQQNHFSDYVGKNEKEYLAFFSWVYLWTYNCWLMLEHLPLKHWSRPSVALGLRTGIGRVYTSGGQISLLSKDEKKTKHENKSFKKIMEHANALTSTLASPIPEFKLTTVNQEYFVCTKFLYAGPPRPFVYMKFSYSRWPLQILWLQLSFSYAFYFLYGSCRVRTRGFRRGASLGFRQNGLICRTELESQDQSA